jgi:predicted nucleic acid-binding protein
MIVADSSYITEALLKDSSLFDGHVICSPDFGLYEVLNSIWKHQVLLKKTKESGPVLEALFDLIAAERIRFIDLAEKTIRSAYELAVKTRTTFYDSAFVALAIELDVELKTFDERQVGLFEKSRKSS